MDSYLSFRDFMFLLFVENPNVALNNERERSPFYGPYFYDDVSDFYWKLGLRWSYLFFFKSVFVMF